MKRLLLSSRTLRGGAGLVFLSVALTACGPGTMQSDAGDVQTDTQTPTDTPTDTQQGGMIRVRVAHLSPNAPAVDFCVRAMGTTSFGNPVLRGLGNTAGLSYTQVTAYLDLPAAAYEVRLVAPNSANCDTALAGLPNFSLPNLPGGTSATAAATGLVGGMGTSAFTITPFVDEPRLPTASNVRLRFVHTAPGVPAVDVGLLDSASGMFNPLFTNVAYPTQLDGNTRYVETATPAGPVNIAVRANGTTPMAGQYPLQLDGVTLPGGRTLTVYAIGQLGNDQTPLSALICDDNDGANGLTACSVAPQRIHVRVAHLSPDAPAVDFCIRPTSAMDSAFQGPVLQGAGLGAGLAFPQVTQYLALAPGQYTVRLVAADATACTTALAGLPNYDLPMLTAGTWATVGAVGQVGSTPATFTLRPYVDTHAPPAAGRIHLRFVHASPGTPNVDVGAVSGTTLTPIWSNVAFPAFGTAMGADANGFLPTDPLSNATLGVRLTGMTDIALSLPGVSIAAGSVRSIFAIGLATGSGNTRLSALICDDRAAATNGLASCVRAP